MIVYDSYVYYVFIDHQAAYARRSNIYQQTIPYLIMYNLQEQTPR